MESKTERSIGVGSVLRQTAAIALVTYRELLRERLLWSSVVFAVLATGLAYAVSQLSFTDHSRIALTFGLTSIALIGGMTSIIMGGALIAREIQNRTVYLVLTKAIWRWQFVLGRFAGLTAILFANLLLMLAVILVQHRLMGGRIDDLIVKGVLLQMTEFGVLAAVASVFSAFSTTALAAIFTTGVWVTGHAMDDIRVLAHKIEPVAARPILELLAATLPDLGRFDIKAQIVHQLPVTWLSVGSTLAYGAFYMAFALAAACFVFSRRDL